MARETTESRPIVVAQLANSLGLGGTERQLVEHLRRLDPRYSPRLMCLTKVGEFLDELRPIGIDPEEYPLRGSLFQPNTAWQIVRLARRLRDDGARLLHCHDFYSNIVGGAAARLAGIPYIVSRRDLGIDRSAARTRMLALVTRAAPQVLCNAEAVRDLVVREGTPAERAAVVYNGLDLARFDREAARVSALPALAEAGPKVVLPGNMQLALKGHAEFLDAAAEVLRARPETRFILVGDGQFRPKYEARARALGLGDRAVFAGWRTDVPAILARCTVAVSASHTEGLSNAIMESMAARLPVVATAVGGTGELVRDGENGFLVPAGRAGPLAARILDVLESPEQARRMGAVGRARIENDFSAARLGGRMAALYDRLLGLPIDVRRAA